MKDSEIRAGNWVHHKAVWSTLQEYERLEEFDFVWTADNWYQVGECLLSLDSVEGILITDEWMVKLGFKLVFGTFSKGDFCLAKPHKNGDKDLFMICNITSPMNPKIRYIHELQNLYYALTNNEL